MTALSMAHTLPEAVHYLVGIDGGGTSTRARLWHRSGTMIGEGRSGPSGLMQGSAQAWENIERALDAAVQGHIRDGWPQPSRSSTALGLGIAGANNPVWAKEFLQTNPGYAFVDLHSDAVTALHGAHASAAGALVICGTGAIGLAQDLHGALRTAGGWGFPCGDEGSGADLGLQAVRLTQQALDGRIAPSALTQATLKFVGGSRKALLAWCGGANQQTYATCAPLVFAAATQDRRAADLIHVAVDCLHAIADAIDPSAALPLVIAGSVGQLLIPQLPTSLTHRITPARGDAMQGAAQLLLRTL